MTSTSALVKNNGRCEGGATGWGVTVSWSVFEEGFPTQDLLRTASFSTSQESFLVDCEGVDALTTPKDEMNRLEST